MLTINDTITENVWEAFLSRKEIMFYPFFQSWQWGEVQKKLGFSVQRIAVMDGSTVVGICQIIDIEAKRGHYLHLRHGPVFNTQDQSVVQYFMTYVKAVAKQRHASFLRMSPFVTEDQDLLRGYAAFCPSPIHSMDAEVCWMLALTKSEDELQREMKKNHRYLMRKAQNMDIKIIRTHNSEDIDRFLKLYKNLSLRKHFVPHRGVKEEFEVFSKKKRELLLMAEYQGTIIAGAIIAFMPGMAIYRHGASADAFRDVPASYLLQWEAIKEAKARNLSWYNFWGIAPEGATKHPWHGLTHFKVGFGGERKEFVHARDYPLSPWYWKTYAIESYIKMIKGY